MRVPEKMEYCSFLDGRSEVLGYLNKKSKLFIDACHSCGKSRAYDINGYLQSFLSVKYRWKISLQTQFNTYKNDEGLSGVS